MHGEQTDLNSKFPTTHWSEVREAGAAAGEARRTALAGLLRAYLPALRYYLMAAWRLDRDNSDDLLQSFVADKVLAHGLLGRAEEGKGRLRHFLMTSLDHFVCNHFRDQSAEKRAPSGQLSLDAAAPVAAPTPDPATIFDRAWARQILAQAVRQMEQECITSAQPHLWGIFQSRILVPALNGSEPTSYEQLVRQYELISPTHASNALVTAKRMFRRILRAVVGRYVKDDTQVEHEIEELRRILSCPAQDR